MYQYYVAKIRTREQATKLRTNFRRYLWFFFFHSWLVFLLSMTWNNIADIFQGFMVFSALQQVIKRGVAKCESWSKE